ncbi:MAG: hypothetical protein KatS3mg111_1834 [Pirellulaceae bacterium]|nr:MAG: hypothetical protein KatS3mg111_1834 [Pirellulaceae bacterium]
MPTRFCPWWLQGLIVSICLGATPSAAQDWIQAMFETTSHDFGVVPRGANAEFRFVLTNKYEEEVHIAAVRSSCGCTEPVIEKPTLKTYEEGAILCRFNTRSFIGPRSAVVTVVVDKPYYGELQLLVKGTIRSDIVVEPGEVDFGEVAQGEEALSQLRITHAGRADWVIDDVRSANQHLGVRLERQSDQAGRCVYQLAVRLKDTAPPGHLHDQIVLVTNDRDFNLVTIPVRGYVAAPLEMPRSIELGTIPTGADLRKSMFIKGNEPFAVTEIQCDDPRFEFELPSGTRKAHVIRFTFHSGDQPGAFRRTVTVKTSLDGNGEASTVIRGNVSGRAP